MRSPEDMLVKVCGVANLDDAIFASEKGADIIGVILDQNVTRHGDAALITAIHDAGIITAGVYTSLDAALQENSDEDLIQLHFPHEPEIVKKVKQETGKRVISVIQFTSAGGLKELAVSHYAADADIVLLENNSGIINSLNHIANVQKSARTGVSGKITPSNAAEFAKVNPLMIDLSSSLEDYPGKKSHKLVSELFRNLEVA